MDFSMGHDWCIFKENNGFIGTFVDYSLIQT